MRPSAFRCILSVSLNEAAYKRNRTGVMEIRIAGSSCRRPQLLFDQIYIFFFSHSIKPSGLFLSFRRQPVDSRNEEAVNSTRNTIYSLRVFYFLLYRRFLFLLYRPRFQRNNIIARDQKSDLHGTSFQSSPKINRMLITRLISIQ